MPAEQTTLITFNYIYHHLLKFQDQNPNTAILPLPCQEAPKVSRNKADNCLLSRRKKTAQKIEKIQALKEQIVGLQSPWQKASPRLRAKAA